MKKQGNRLEPGILRAQLIAVLTVILLLVVAMFGLAALSAFDRAIAPELENRTRLIGSILRSEVQNTLDLGIPFEALGGLDAFLEETIHNFGEVKRVAIIQGEANVIAEVARAETPSLFQRSGLGTAAGIGAKKFTLPILVGNEFVGEIQIESSPQFVETKLRDVFLDISVLAIVALLLGVELALAIAAASVWKPYGRVLRLLSEQVSGQFVHTIRETGVSGIRRAAVRLNKQAEDLAQRLRNLPDYLRRATDDRQQIPRLLAVLRPMRYSDFNDVRLALFLFATATEITAAFLPVYARDAARPEWLATELSAAAPLCVYLVAVALLSLFGGTMARRFGARRIFVFSSVPTALALAAMGWADSLIAIVILRGVIGVFYALATIACQEYALRAGGSAEATQSSSAFVGMIFGGAFCGSVLGGVIAERFGFPAALVFGAAMALIAGSVAHSAMRGRAGAPTRDRSVLSDHKATDSSGNNVAFAALLLCIAIPMNATTAIFIWYLTPLQLASLGFAPGDTARVVMLYFLASTLIGPLAKNLASYRAGAVPPVVAGAALSGLVLLLLRDTGNPLAYFVAVSGCGIGHALIRAPMTALAVNLSGGSGAKMSALRFGERIGALCGLLSSAFLLASYDPRYAITSLGVIGLVGGGIFAIIMVLKPGKRGRRHE